MGLFLDLFHVPAGVTNDALEGIYKALSEGDGHEGDGVWRPHESPLIRRLVELFTERGLMRLEAVHKEYLAWQEGAHHKQAASPVTPPGIMVRWTKPELELARLYLESLPPGAWTFEDHMLAIEYVVQVYLPPDDLVKEADWLATKAGMMGKVQANMQGSATLKQADAILAALPSSLAEAVGAGALSQRQATVIAFSKARAAENVRALSEKVRHRMRTVITVDLEQKALGGAPAGGSSLQTKLADEFAVLNRDWRRIAVTEAGEAQTQGYIASLKPGTKVKRVEQYANACSFCRRIDGVVATVVPADQPDKDPDTMVWPGKNNIGRSASPRKRVGDVLVERKPEEMWTLPAGLAHPHCRGRWVPVIADEPGDDPAFADQLRAILGSG